MSMSEMPSVVTQHTRSEIYVCIYSHVRKKGVAVWPERREFWQQRLAALFAQNELLLIVDSMMSLPLLIEQYALYQAYACSGVER